MIQENEASEAQDVVENQIDSTDAQTDAQDNALSKEQTYAKKMRQRAQVAEDKLNEMKQIMKDKDDAQLAEQGKYKEMYSKLKSDSDIWKKNSDEYTEYQKSEKNVLLEQLPEEDREMFADLKLPQLKKLVNKVVAKPSQPKVIHGNIDAKGGKSFEEMTEKERKQNWGSMVNGYFDEAKKTNK